MKTVSPLRATASAPVGDSGSGGKRSLSSRAAARRAGSAFAVATSRIPPVPSRMLTTHQSATSGVAMLATLASVSSKSSDESRITPARARKSARMRASRSACRSARRSVLSMTVAPTPITVRPSSPRTGVTDEIQWRISPGRPGSSPLASRSSRASPDATTSRWSAASWIPTGPGTSSTRRPTWSSTGRPFIATSASLTRT